MDLPGYHDILTQLHQELQVLKSVASSAQGHTAAMLTGSSSTAAVQGGTGGTAGSTSGAAGGSTVLAVEGARGRAHLPWALKYAPVASSQVGGVQVDWLVG